MAANKIILSSMKIAILIAIQIFIQNNLLCQLLPVAPYVEEKICPYEYGCEFDKWISLTQKPLFLKDGDSSSIAYWMEPGDSLIFNYGNMHIDQMGIAIVFRNHKEFIVGDTLLILSYTGEGYYNVWFKGSIKNVHIFWNEDRQLNSNHYSAHLIIPQRMTWWVLLTNVKGQKGWLPLPNSCNYGACFGDNIFKSTEY